MKFPVFSQRVSPPGDTARSSLSDATTTPGEPLGPAADDGALPESGPLTTALRGVLVGLIVPFAVIVLNMLMFGVAVPAIRDQFAMDADTVALLITAYTLPFVLFMPMYGQLADSLGKRRMFSIGLVIFFAGTVVCLFSTTLGLLFLGRILQGIGTAGINPLSIALITDLFPPNQRGRALGAWSSTGPAASVVAPLLSGFLIDKWGWQSMFVPIILGAAVSLYVVHVRLPSTKPQESGVLRKFDWLGLLLLSSLIIAFVLYLTSRPITGIEPLRDWRLLLLMPALVAGLLWRERRAHRPLVPLHLFRYAGFGRASIVAGVRMFLMSGFGLLIPLYLVDIHGFSAARVGLYSTSLSVALLITTPVGGRLADRWDRRMPVAAGMMMQAFAISAMALVPANAPHWQIPLALVFDGLGAGLSLAVLPRIAMDQVPKHESGVAAGLYSMNRYFGSILGATLVGVFLQQALLRQTTIEAYQASFWFSAAFAVLGVVVIWRVKG